MTLGDDVLATAMDQHQAGRLAEAAHFYRLILSALPHHADALHLLGVIAHQGGRNDEAVALIGRAIAISVQEAGYHANLGLALMGLRRHRESLAASLVALLIKPDHAEAYSNLGIALQELGRLDDAVAASAAALSLRPDAAEARYNRGNALLAQGRLTMAIAAYRLALCLRPHLAEAHYNQGNALAALRRWSEAAVAFRAALRLKPVYVEAWCNLGNVLQEEGRLTEAVAACRAALDLKPDHAKAQSNLGNALKDLGRPDEAVAAYEAALRLKPDFAEAHSNLASVLKDLGRLENAAAACRRAICIKPDGAEVYSTLGVVSGTSGDQNAAVAAFRRALRVKPDDADAHHNLGLTLLLIGRWEEGWSEYEWRWRMKEFRSVRRNFRQPQWRGENLLGKAILLHAEQGLGDSLQFCRYAPLVAARGGRVILEVQRPLLRLMRSLPGVHQVLAVGDPLPDVDFHCPLLSLPAAFGTRLDSLPADCPYLSAPREAIAAWRDRLPREGLRIGIAWLGNPNYRDDRARSIPLKSIGALIRAASSSGIRIVSLQKQPSEPPADLAMIDFMDEIVDFADTAAVIANLDLVISVDSAVAHLAGALGKPVWLLNRFAPDWRWLLGRSDSPWYPTMRLFRQTTPGDWGGVLDRVSRALQSLIEDQPPPVFAEALRQHQAGRLGDAQRLYRQSLHSESRQADCWHMLGVIEHQLGRSNAAIDLIGKAIAADGSVASYHSNLGAALKETGRLDDAVLSFRTALLIAPDHAEAHCNLGATLKDLRRGEAAIAAYRAALRIAPDFADAHANLADALHQIGRPEAAIAACKMALCLAPSSVEALCNLGVAHTELGCPDAAIIAQRAALQIKPDLAEAHHNLGLALLSVGRWQEGWPEFDWRLRRKTFAAPRRQFRQPLWQGEDLAGKTILLHAEQGLGDAIQFCRYAPLVAALGGRVILELHRPLMRLASGLPLVDRVVAAGDPLPAFDLHCSLMSLPRWFGTAPDTVPPAPPFTVEPARLAHWQKRLRSPGFKIGIVWQGNPNYRDDRDRSVPLALFAPLAKIAGVRLVSLQQRHGLEQLGALPEGMRVERLDIDPRSGAATTFDEGANAFIDTAAVMMTLDLIVTVDTATAHLAGTLGRPVWVPLATSPHWVWLLDRGDTPWYPTMRLFRQQERGAWRELFDRMAKELDALRRNGVRR